MSWPRWRQSRIGLFATSGAQANATWVTLGWAGYVPRGKTSREIAALLVLSPYTVRKHIENLLAKLEVPTRSTAVARLNGEPRV